MDRAAHREKAKRAAGDEVAIRLRRADPDRFLCALFVPAPLRADAFALCGFHHALERASFGAPAQSAHGPVAAMIRLNWWREVLDAERDDWRGNELAVRLRGIVDRGPVPAPVLRGMVEAYEDAAAEGVGGEFARRGPGGLQTALALLCGEADPAAIDRAAAAGAAYALSRRPAHRSGPDSTATAAEAGRLLREVAGPLPPRDRRAALLPAVLAARDLRAARAEREPRRGLSDRSAVAWAALRPAGRLVAPPE